MSRKDNFSVIQNNIKVAKGVSAPNDNRDMNLVNMILNIEANNSNDYRKPSDVYQIYAQMNELNINTQFKESLLNSEKCVKIPPLTNNNLSNLRQNDPNSFLVLPLLGTGHLWSVVIRKTDEGYNAHVINKGLTYWHDSVEEFVFKKENKGKLVDVMKYAGFALINNNVEDVYRKFISNSDAQYNTRINASPQKVGNCFTKNIQAGIKFAYATLEIHPSKLNALRIPKEYTPYGTKGVNKVTFKWETVKTGDMQKLFANKIIQKNPRIEDKVIQSINIYDSNKNFRNKIKLGKSPLETFFRSFDYNNHTKEMPTNERIKKLMCNVTPYTYAKYRESINKIVDSTKDNNYKKLYNTLNKYTEVGSIKMSAQYLFLYLHGGHDTVKSLEAIYDRNGEFKNLQPQQKAKALLSKLDTAALGMFKNKLMPVVEFAYGNENAQNEYKNLFERAKINERKLNSLIPSREVMAQINQNFPIIVGQVNHRISEYNKVIEECRQHMREINRFEMPQRNRKMQMELH